MYSIKRSTINTKTHLITQMIRSTCFLLFFSLYISLNNAYSQRVEKVTLQLKWKSQFQFAGYYAALEKGFYSNEGLNVEIRELDKPGTTLEHVLCGDAQYGIGNAELVAQYMNGIPVVVIASILQNSPSALAVKSNSNIYSPKDFIGKRIEIDKEESGIEIMAMFLKEGITANQIKTTSSTFSLNNLLSNQVDALSVYTSSEPFFLDKFGIPFRLIKPKDYGINFYADCLFTTKEEIEKHPDRVKKFRRASLKGWEYALNHPDELANIIQTKYKSTKTLEHLQFEAEELRKLILPEFIQIGHNNKERWMGIVETLSQQGMITQYRDINGFIYNPENDGNSFKTKVLTAIIIIIGLSFVLMSYLYFKVKKRLTIQGNEINNLSKRYEAQVKETNRLRTEINNHKKQTV